MSMPADHGTDWERPISMEILNDPLNPSANGFQENGGAPHPRGFSRSSDDPKQFIPDILPVRIRRQKDEIQTFWRRGFIGV
jgi:hypothetical protein